MSEIFRSSAVFLIDSDTSSNSHTSASGQVVSAQSTPSHAATNAKSHAGGIAATVIICLAALGAVITVSVWNSIFSPSISVCVATHGSRLLFITY
jgi:hypothetical protein